MISLSITNSLSVFKICWSHPTILASVISFSSIEFFSLTGFPEELELWYQQWPLVPICLLRECRQIWVSLSCFWNLSYWWRFSVLFDEIAAYLLPPSRKILRGQRVKHRRHIQSWSRHLLSLSWKISRNSHPGKRYWLQGWLKDARGTTHPVER